MKIKLIKGLKIGKIIEIADIKARAYIKKGFAIEVKEIKKSKKRGK